MANSTGSLYKSHSRLLSRKMHSLSPNKTWSDRERRIAGIIISGTSLIFEAGKLASMNEDQIDASDGFFGWSTFDCFCRVWGNPGAFFLWFSWLLQSPIDMNCMGLSCYLVIDIYFPSIDGRSLGAPAWKVYAGSTRSRTYLRFYRQAKETKSTRWIQTTRITIGECHHGGKK